MTRYYCDRCGAECQSPNNYQIALWDGSSKLLCQTCYELLGRWLDGWNDPATG